jgi:hypothetical protein
MFEHNQFINQIKIKFIHHFETLLKLFKLSIITFLITVKKIIIVFLKLFSI